MNNNTTSPNSHEFPVQSDFSTEEMGNIPRTAHECFPESFPQTDEVSDVTDTYPHKEPHVEATTEQTESNTNNPRSSKYILRHIPKPNCNDDYRYWTFSWTSDIYGTRTETSQKFKEPVTWHFRSSSIFWYILFWLVPGEYLFCYPVLTTSKDGHWY